MSKGAVRDRYPEDMADVDGFVMDAGRAMTDRLADGVLRGWGTSWREATYTDMEVRSRLVRAVDHLNAALRCYRSGDCGTEEVRKRAADVANQAFMLADPARLEAQP